VVILAVNAVTGHIVQSVVHPAHVPFVVEAQSSPLGVGGDPRKGGAFFGEEQAAGELGMYHLGKLAEEIYGAKVFVSAVLIWQPLTRLLAIVKVQHAAYRIHTQTVHVVFLHEVYGIGYEEAADLVLFIIEQHGSPLRLLTPPGIRMLEKGGAVGRKLDFIVQEMNRETNTIGSKAQNIEIAQTVVDIKSEIEKIREQIQNIE